MREVVGFMAALREGDRIHNYLLDAKIGAGSFGDVWRARHHVFGETVAVKIPTDPEFVRNLQREGIAVHGLRHPNIVRAIDLDPYADPPYLIMEYIEGPSLREAIDAWKGRFPIQAAVVILRGLLRALGAAHDGGLIHRDVKPANVLLRRSLESIDAIREQDVKVTDFGLGSIRNLSATKSLLQSGSLTAESDRELAGTWAYMSPEQREGRPLDGRSDLYSCGIVLFEMLTGERPQGFDLPGALRRDVPPGLDDVFRRSYARLENRFASAAEMLNALGESQQRGAHLDAVVPPGWAGGRVTACPSCELSVDPDDQFCIRCGRQLVASVPRCPTCRAYVHHSDRFCILCGKDLGVLT